MRATTHRSGDAVAVQGHDLATLLGQLITTQMPCSEAEAIAERAIRDAGFHPEVDASSTVPCWRLVDDQAATVGVVVLVEGGAR